MRNTLATAKFFCLLCKLLAKHDAQCLLVPVAADAEATLESAFTLTPRSPRARGCGSFLNF